MSDRVALAREIAARTEPRFIEIKQRQAAGGEAEGVEGENGLSYGPATATAAKPATDGALRFEREAPIEGGTATGATSEMEMCLLKRGRWLRDYCRLVMPPATSHSDCSRNDDCESK